ncbi:RNA-directed DNA polymerase from mobile element jockey [Fusarium oxysporum f. sp. albedinis]|nr:RNA-directed DNA polymerase from mobile element jockey [Fusarium oxysporum f. sp. albedinis]
MPTPSDLFSQSVTDANNCSELSSQPDLTKLYSSSSLGTSIAVKDWSTVSQTVHGHWNLSTRTGQATGWFWAHGYNVQAKTATTERGPSSWLCCHCTQQKVHKPKAYAASNTRNIENHLSKAHSVFHPDPSKAKRYVLERPLNQCNLHEFTSRKRKREDLHDELVARFDKVTFQRLLVRWITDANLPFRLLEHVGLHELFDYLNPLVRESSANLTHKTIRAKVIHEFNTYKAHVTDTLLRSPSKVHIALDGWTSRNRHSFFSINAFFLDDETFQPRKILLGLPSVAMAHTGENICAAVTEVLEEFELVQHNKLGYFVLDNASNNDKAVEELGRKFEWHEPATRRIRCFGHVLHLVATAMLFVHDTQALEDLDPDDFDEWTKRGPVGKLHNLVVWINRSNKATVILRRLQDDDPDKNYPGTLDVVLDNCTRWLSQYYMIERAIKLRRYLEELVDITIQTNRKLARSRSKVEKSRSSLPSCLEEDNVLTDADWEALNWFSNILTTIWRRCLLDLIEHSHQNCKYANEDRG